MGQLLTWHTLFGKGGFSIINTRHAPYLSGPFWQVIKTFHQNEVIHIQQNIN